MNRLNIPTNFGVGVGDRIRGRIIVKPIIFGNLARSFNKIIKNGHTHQWKLYVKPYCNEKMSAYVKKIQFWLDDSYQNPIRTVSEPPFEIIETGWNEFQVAIKIYFQDPTEPPFTLHHFLRLDKSPHDYGVMTSACTVSTESSKKSDAAHFPLVFESYEELVFNEPSQLMQLLLEVMPFIDERYLHDTYYKINEKIEKEKVRAPEDVEYDKGEVRYEIPELQTVRAGKTTLEFKMEITKEKFLPNIAENQEL